LLLSVMTYMFPPTTAEGMFDKITVAVLFASGIFGPSTWMLSSHDSIATSSTNIGITLVFISLLGFKLKAQ
jgi:hypothetical protein